MDNLPEKISALILAGGLSSRMGRDKAWLDLGGMPLVEHVSRRILPLASELIFSTNKSDRFEALLDRLPVATRLVADQVPSVGPLSGIASGLGIAANDLVLVLAADMPFVHLGLLSHMVSLAGDFEAVVPKTLDRHSGKLRAEPLHACYRRSCLTSITAHLEAGDLRTVSFLPDVRTRWVLPAEIALFDADFLSFRNVNTPADWDMVVRELALD